MDTLELNELKEQKKDSPVGQSRALTTKSPTRSRWSSGSNQSKINKKQYKEDYNAKLVECECGLICRYSNLFRHYKSYRHVTYIESLNI